MKAILASAAMILMLAAPAYAQSKEQVPTPEQMMDGKTPDVIEKFPLVPLPKTTGDVVLETEKD